MSSIAGFVLNELVVHNFLHESALADDDNANLLPFCRQQQITSEQPSIHPFGVLEIGLRSQFNSGDVDFCHHLFWWPSGIPPQQLVSVLSSRLDRQLENWPAWFAGLRAVCANLSDSDRLVAARRTAAGQFVERAAELFGKQTLIVHTENEPQTTGASAQIGAIERWWQAVRAQQPTSTMATHLYVSPTVVAATKPEISAYSIPLRDRLACSLGHRLRVLHLSDSGATKQLLLDRLRAKNSAVGSVRILLGERTMTDKTRDELLASGGVGWWLGPTTRPADGTTSTIGTNNQTASRFTSRRILSKRLTSGEWLTHCTRRRRGPWPLQPPEKYLDELIFEEPAANRSAIATLERIVKQHRLIASSDGVRGKTPVVCFTAVSLSELHRLNVFRPHRGRWDFQPYGICLSRAWLENAGAKPVRYASASEWDQLPSNERPFFQLERSGTKSGKEIDWTVEQEWRTIHDVDLSLPKSDEVIVFVPTEDAAEQIQQQTDWQICVLPQK